MVRQKHSARRSGSIIRKMMLPMIIVALLQTGVFYAATSFGGITTQLRNNSFDIMNERVAARAAYLQNDMLQRWSSFGPTADNLALLYQAARLDTEEGMGGYLEEAALELASLLRSNTTTGAFIVLAPRQDPGYSGVYIRDLDPQSAAKGNTDLVIEVAPAHVARTLNLPMDAWWTESFSLSPGNPDNDFFFKPMAVAREHPDIGVKNMGYWSPPFRLSGNDIDIITYSIPLLDARREPYGVLGVEISADYLARQLPSAEINADSPGSYLLAVRAREGAEYQNAAVTGQLYGRLFGAAGITRLERPPVYDKLFPIANPDASAPLAYGSLHRLNLYNTNTPFLNEEWALIGVMRRDDLLHMASQVHSLLIFSSVVALLIGIASAVVIAAVITRPVSYLARQLRTSDPRQPVRFEKTRITEIDELSAAIVSLSRNVADAASKLSQIIGLSDMTLGAYEFTHEHDQVAYMGRLFEALGFADSEGWMGSAEFESQMMRNSPVMEESSPDGTEKVFNMKAAPEPMWVRIKIIREPSRELGVMVDVTRDILVKRQLEFERDYDLLTNLFNRRAFFEQVNALSPETVGVAAMVMMDLDNLKYVNDTYGHDYGDAYIRTAAGVMKRFISRKALISRISGDEFLIFLYGCGDKAQALDLLKEIKVGLDSTELPLPEGGRIKIRASAGVAWYPEDTASIDLLIKYADFAMYKVKHSVKGGTREFERDVYEKDAYLLHSKEALNLLIDNQLVEYHFQPIVSAVSGEIHAYEALMRSKSDAFKSPFEILTLARAQSQLYSIERLTWLRAPADYFERQGEPGKYKLFINSISNQALSDEDIAEIERLYGPMLSLIVIEMTEEEKIDDKCANKKAEVLARWHSDFAIDDYGTGYNGEAVLLQLSPRYIKVDISIIHGIDSDSSRQMLLRNLVAYTKQRDILVIAEGVETYAEMGTVIDCGVDFLQGYYLARPARDPGQISEGVREEIRVAAAHAK